MNNTQIINLEDWQLVQNMPHLAERYAADAEYDTGTVVRIGGTHEITQTMQHADTDVFGIVSTVPGFEMNAGAGTDATHPFVALAGRVPVK